MITGIGIDVVDLKRMEKILLRNGERFLNHILAPEEKALLAGHDATCFNNAHITYVGGRFAAKEAISKSLGTGFSCGISPTDIIILSGPSGAPQALCRGNAKKRLHELDNPEIHVSISHERSMAVAVAVLENEKKSIAERIQDTGTTCN